MSANPAPAYPQVIVYPDSDGKPMADNTQQLRWIFTLYGNLAAQYRLRPDVFVGSNQFWYPVEGEPDVRVAPDVYVVFGRPKGDRGSYQQWREDNVPLTVVFEILSPGNTHWEMRDKLFFFEDHGVEEYYVYDPDINRLEASVRDANGLLRPKKPTGFVSPRLGIRFELSRSDLTVVGPDGKPFLTFEELQAAREQSDQRAETAEGQVDEARALLAEQTERAESAEAALSEAQRRLQDLEAKLRALGGEGSG